MNSYSISQQNTTHTTLTLAQRDHRGRYRMVVGYTTIHAIYAYHH